MFQYHALILAVCPLNDIYIYRKRRDRYQDNIYYIYNIASYIMLYLSMSVSKFY